MFRDQFKEYSAEDKNLIDIGFREEHANESGI
jgi:hypothetical protein